MPYCGISRHFILLVVLCVSSIHLTSAVKYKDVGFGRHKMYEGQIFKMGLNKKIATAENYKDYKTTEGSLNACDVTLEGEYIILHYNRSTKTSTDGCAVDMLTKRSWNDHFDFEVELKHNAELKECLGDEDGGKFSENLVPFAHSIDTQTFLKNNKNPLDHNVACERSCSMEKCPKCGKSCPSLPGLEIAWSKGPAYPYVHVQPINEPHTKKCALRGQLSDKSSDNLKVKMHDPKAYSGEWIELSGLSPDKLETDCKKGTVLKYKQSDNFFCLRKDQIVRPNAWKIKDDIKGFKPPVDFNYLFSFYLLPQTASRIRDSKLHIKQEDKPNGPNCDEVQFKFLANDYKLLINGEQDVAPPIPPSGSNQTDISPKQPPPSVPTETTIKPTTKKAKSNTTWIIVAGICGAILLILVIVGIILFVMISKGEKDDIGGETTAAATTAATKKKDGGKTKKPEQKGKSGAKKGKK